MPQRGGATKKAKGNCGDAVVVVVDHHHHRDDDDDASSRISDALWGDPVMVPSTARDFLKVLPMLAAEIDASQGGVLMSKVSEEMPMPVELQHVKRVKKVKKGGVVKLQVLLEKGASVEQASPCAARILEGLSASCRSLVVAQVPVYAPHTKEAQKDWTEKYWPVSLRAPDKMSLKEDTELTVSDIKGMKQFMSVVHNMAMRSVGTGGSENACVIVDPSTQRIVGSGVDTSSCHPLQHPILNAVQEVADWQVDTWYSTLYPPSDEEEDQERRGMENTKVDGHLEGIAAMHKAERRGSALCRYTQDTCHTVHDAPDETESSYSASSLPPYLCTGYDCYVFQEPCAMCAMAMVHSRLRRVIFCHGDSTSGMLGGSGTRLHSLKSLNHHFVVYQMPFKERERK